MVSSTHLKDCCDYVLLLGLKRWSFLGNREMHVLFINFNFAFLIFFVSGYINTCLVNWCSLCKLQCLGCKLKTICESQGSAANRHFNRCLGQRLGCGELFDMCRSMASVLQRERCRAWGERLCVTIGGELLTPKGILPLQQWLIRCSKSNWLHSRVECWIVKACCKTRCVRNSKVS